MAGTFQWYPGEKARLDARTMRALDATAKDILDDLKDDMLLPRAPTARKRGHVAGRLQESGKVVPARSAKGGAKIVFTAPYAARAYYHPEWRFSTEWNSNARGQWFRPYIKGYKSLFVRLAFASHMRRLF